MSFTTDMRVGRNLAKTFADYYKLIPQVLPKQTASAFNFRFELSFKQFLYWLFDYCDI